MKILQALAQKCPPVRFGKPVGDWKSKKLPAFDLSALAHNYASTLRAVDMSMAVALCHTFAPSAVYASSFAGCWLVSFTRLVQAKTLLLDCRSRVIYSFVTNAFFRKGVNKL